MGVLDDLLVQLPVFTFCQHFQPVSLGFLVDPCNCLAVSIRGEHQPGLGLSSEPRIPARLCCAENASCVLQTLLSYPRAAFCRY